MKYKFRAWNGKEMIYGVTPFQWDFVLYRNFWKCIKSNGSGILNSGGTEAKFEVDGYSFKELMQFTGVTDKTGKDMYKGDIVEHDWLGIGQVKWDESYTGYYVYIDDSDEGSLMMRDPDDPENSPYTIIGNVYENPDLL